jgi:[ribosomal protein S5]-alanine N-acetyltransferase
MNTTIQTDQLLLRTFLPEDVDPLYKIQSDSMAMKYTVCTRSREETENRLMAYAKEENTLGFAPWTILLRSEKRVIGWGGLNIDPFTPGWGVEVIYFFHPNYWGRGFGTELVKISVNQGFYKHKIREMHAFVHRENIASIRVLTKNKFNYLRYESKLNRNHYLLTLEN